MKRAEAIDLLKRVNPDLEDADLYLNPEDRPKISEWVSALRSGEYDQADGVLYQAASDDYDEHIPEGYCCLGVYCRKVLGIAGDMPKTNKTDSAEFPKDIGADMPRQLREAQEKMARR